MKTKIISLLMLIPLALSIVFLISCETDGQEGNNAPDPAVATADSSSIPSESSTDEKSEPETTAVFQVLVATETQDVSDSATSEVVQRADVIESREQPEDVDQDDVKSAIELSPVSTSETSSIVILVLCLSVAANLMLAAIALYFFRWRTLVVNDQNTLMPERWVTGFVSSIDKLGDVIQQLTQFSASNRSNINNIAEILDTLQRSLDDKDQEIKRYKRGYDSHLYKKFISKFVLISETLRQILDKDEFSKSEGENIHFRLQDALDDCGVTTKEIEAGLDYINLGSLVTDNPRLIEAEDSSQAFKVAECLRPAFILSTAGDDQVIIPAKITVYSYSQGG